MIFRRTAARNLRRAGIAEGVIMSIGGWKTRSVFESYAIVSRTDIADAMRRLQQTDKALGISHELVTVPTPDKSDQIAAVPTALQNLHTA